MQHHISHNKTLFFLAQNHSIKRLVNYMLVSLIIKAQHKRIFEVLPDSGLDG